MRDFVQEWRASFDREKASYKSFVVFMEMKLRQGLHLGLGQEQNEVVTYQRAIARPRRAHSLRGPRSAVAHATDLINALLEPEPDAASARAPAASPSCRLTRSSTASTGRRSRRGPEGDLRRSPPSRATSSTSCVPDGGDGQPNPELGIETEPCPAELLSADGEAERSDGGRSSEMSYSHG